MIRAVYFDAIDTLFQPWPNKTEVYVRIIEEVTGLKVSAQNMKKAWDKVLPETEAAALFESKHGMKDKLAWVGFNGNLLRELGYEGDCAAMGQKLQEESWNNPDNYHLYPDVLPALKELKKRAIRIACVSNEDGYLHTFFEQKRIKDYFEILVTSGEIGSEKPSPEIFEAALSKMKLSASEVLFIGDSLVSDYFGSAAVGMKPVLIDRERKISDDKVTRVDKLTDLLEYLND